MLQVLIGFGKSRQVSLGERKRRIRVGYSPDGPDCADPSEDYFNSEVLVVGFGEPSF